MHGIEHTRGKSGPKPAQISQSGIIGLIGTAPIFAVEKESRTKQTPVTITNRTNAVKFFGQNYSGYTIPSALESIYNQTTAKVIVINVFDPQKHKASISGSKTFSNGKIELQERGIFNLTVTKDSTKAEEGTDYTFDGKTVKIKDGGILSISDTVTLSYDYADPTKVTIADIIGGVDEDGVKSGLEVFKDCKALLGYKPNMILVPTFGESNTVKNALQVICQKLKNKAYLDAPIGTTIAEAIKGRGELGEINFGISDTRIELCYPHVRVYNSTEDTYELKPLSPFVAARKVRTINEHNVAWSASNKPVNGIEGLEVAISFDPTDKESDASQLNDMGITTIINDRGQYKIWGNRNSAYPSSVDVDTFECVASTADMIEETTTNAIMDMIDGPIDDPLIDDILDVVKNIFKSLENPANKVILDGDVWFDKEENPAVELAKGIINLNYDFLSPPPAENIRCKGIINVNYLSNIGGGE